jgi:hypothetical protein
MLLAATPPLNAQALNAQDEPAQRTLSVAKVVSGDPPPDATFTVTVECVPVGPTGVGEVGTTVAGEWELGFTASGLPDTTRPPVVDDPAPFLEAWQVANDAWELSVPVMFEAFCTATETNTAGAAGVTWGCTYTPAPLAPDTPDPDPCPPGATGVSITVGLPDATLADDCSVPPYLPGCVDATTLTVTNTFPASSDPEPEPENETPEDPPGGPPATPARAVPTFTS